METQTTKTPEQQCKEAMANIKLMTMKWVCERRIKRYQAEIDRIDAYLATRPAGNPQLVLHPHC
jgi:hypothetical protein